jgi:hypothetical protein
VTLAVKVGCLPLVVWPLPANPIRTLGANRSAAQPVAPNGLIATAVLPSVEARLASTADEEQLVGLTMNPARSIATSTLRIRSGIPPTTCGKGAETIVTCASVLSICNTARVATVPRLNGPATAGTTIDSPNGAPA